MEQLVITVTMPELMPPNMRLQDAVHAGLLEFMAHEIYRDATVDTRVFTARTGLTFEWRRERKPGPIRLEL